MNNDLEEEFKKLDQQKDKIGKIINPFLSGNLTKKQGIELCHVGKFLSIMTDAFIIERTESPDFIISYQNERIGLEHERLLISDKVQKVKSIEKLFNDAAKLFEQTYPQYKLLADCELTDDNFHFQKKDAENLKHEIVEYIYTLATEEKKIEKPSYIDKVIIMPHTQVDFIYSPNLHNTQNLSKDILLQAIQKKEMLVKNYIKKSTLTKQWLLIVIGSLSPDSYEFSKEILLSDITSDFEKIFLMHDFNFKVWTLKQ